MPSIYSHFGVNAPVCSPSKSKEKAHADKLRLRGVQPTRRLFPTLRLFPVTGHSELDHDELCEPEVGFEEIRPLISAKPVSG